MCTVLPTTSYRIKSWESQIHMTSRHWCFTWNNPDGLIDWTLYPTVRYAIYQHEVGDDTATQHFQGYIEFNCPTRLAAARNILPTAHWEPRRGSRDQAREYCRKPDTRVDGPYEFGKWISGGGSRTDLISVQEDLDNGVSMPDIASNHFGTFLRYHKGLALYSLLKTPSRTKKTTGVFIFGPTGTGKTTYCLEQSPTCYFKQPSQWWDAYNGTDPVVLDDFYGWLPYHELLRIIDKFPYMVQSKGGQVPFLAPICYITSNKKPHHWYKDEKITSDMSALERRIERWIIVPEQGVFHEYDNPGDFTSKCYELGI